MFFERLNLLLSQNGITRKKLLDDLKMSKNQIKRWEDGKTTPTSSTLKMLADYFGVTVDYLLGSESLPSPSERAAALMGDQLTEEEAELLSHFRELNGEGQEAVLAMIKGFASQSAYKKYPTLELDNKKQA